MTTKLQLSSSDFFLDEREKSARILSRFTVQTIDSPQEPEFDAAYKLLDAEFGARGELERREVLEKWLLTPPQKAALSISETGEGKEAGLVRTPEPTKVGTSARSPGLQSGEQGIKYFIVLVRDEDGGIAGVRDCYVTNDAASPERCVVYLAHVLVLPAYRRSGVASLLRTAPVVLARQVTATRTEKAAEILLAGEMEPLDLAHADTLVRLVAYGKSGFWAIPPTYLPYCQPDFRDLELLQVPPKPIPLLAVVRYVGRESESMAPTWVARAFVERLYGIFAESCRAEDLRPALEHSLSSVAKIPGEEFALLPLPRNAEDAARMTPLLRENVLVYFPASPGTSPTTSWSPSPTS